LYHSPLGSRAFFRTCIEGDKEEEGGEEEEEEEEEERCPPRQKLNVERLKAKVEPM